MKPSNHRAIPAAFQRILFLLLAFVPLTRTTAQSLTIRHFGLADGDATLFIFNDLKKLDPSFNNTYTVLVDSERDYCYPQLITGVKQLLTQVGHLQLDVALVSHMHIDHYGSMVNLLSSLLADGYKIGAVVDRLHLTTPNLDLDGEDVDTCYDYVDTPPLSSAAGSYRQYMSAGSSAGAFRWTSVQVGGNILPEALKPVFSMTCVAVNGVTRLPDGSTTIFLPPKKNSDQYKPKSQNDLSYCFLLNFGAFNYFTGGDLGGDSVKYSNGETPVSQYIASVENSAVSGFHTCAFKVDHHGSASSSNPTFLGLLNPSLAVVSAALRSYSGTTLPTQAAITNISAVTPYIAYTFLPANPSAGVNQWILQYLQDVQISIPAYIAPGNPVSMSVNTYRRNASTRELDGTTTTTPFTCNKTHPVFQNIP